MKPIAFASRTLQKHEKNYGITELEGLGVVWAVKHFQPYIYGHHCIVYTDHEALKSLLNTPQPSGKLARWGLALQEMDLEICYRASKQNSNADALSRNPTAAPQDGSPTFRVITHLQPEVDARGGEPTWATEQRQDSDLLEIVIYLETGELPMDEKRARELALTKSQYVLIDICVTLCGKRQIPPSNSP